VFRQHTAREWFDFAEGDGLKSASALKPKAKAADAGKEVEDAQLFHYCTTFHRALTASRKAVCSRSGSPLNLGLVKSRTSASRLLMLAISSRIAVTSFWMEARDFMACARP
jgi:hypothetical protein